ncbi:MAG: cytochrome c maturation protein CcmE [Deltaproteobacteria bacterium]|nr:cytochrome c maturation protein CcmE [Deltaproteobacteria bacterium]
MKKIVLIAIVTIAILFPIGYLIFGGLEKNMVYFVTPTELLAKGKSAIDVPVRLGGAVAEGSIAFKEGVITFKVTDNTNSMSVVTTRTPPEMFREGIGVVLEGRLKADGVFNAERLLVKHSNEYHPPKEGEMPHEVYKSLQKQK